MKREEAIKLIDTHTVCFYNEIDSPTLQALHLAIEALSADAVPFEVQLQSTREVLDRFAENRVKVVRCKDCKWQKFIDWGMGDCLHPKGSRHIAYDNHYCSYGERREP